VNVAQIVTADASQYERKSQRLDAAALSGAGHSLVDDPVSADIVHVYAGRELPRIEFATPFVANVGAKRPRFALRRGASPRVVVTPFDVPEAVDDAYFDDDGSLRFEVRGSSEEGGGHAVGSYLRASVENTIQLTMARIDRFRSDVEWRVFTHAPTPQDVASVSVWADPAVDEHDYDGFVAEALAAGTIAVAARTEINVSRLENGRAGLLVAPRDPNEWSHAILAALFKPERSRVWSDAARQTVSKFRSKSRLRALLKLYESILR
jgi:glycosyltransferase involved in cell wall biosynthesis